MNQEITAFELWVKGLIAAAIGGAATGVAIIQFQNGSDINWHQVYAVGSVGALIAVSGYLSKSPIWNSNK